MSNASASSSTAPARCRPGDGAASCYVVAAGFLVALVGVFRSLVTGLLMLAWRWVVTRVRPDRHVELTTAAITMGAIGSMAAVAVGFAVPVQNLEFGIAIIAAVGAFVLGRQAVTPATATMLLVAAAMMASRVLAVHASDGGFSECGGNILNCPGFDQSMLQALFGATGAAAGAVAGALAGDGSDDWKPGDGTSDPP